MPSLLPALGLATDSRASAATRSWRARRVPSPRSSAALGPCARAWDRRRARRRGPCPRDGPTSRTRRRWRPSVPCAPRSPAVLASRRRRREDEARQGARPAQTLRGTHVLPWALFLHCRIWAVKIRVARLGGCELDLRAERIYDAA